MDGNPFRVNETHEDGPGSPFEDSYAEMDLEVPQRAASSSQREVKGIRMAHNNGNLPSDMQDDVASSFRDYDSVDERDDKDTAYIEQHSFQQKRSRWGTHRGPPRQSSARKASNKLGRQMSQMLHLGDSQDRRASLRAKQQKRVSSIPENFYTDGDSQGDGPTSPTEEEPAVGGEQRRIFFNRPLPQEMVDKDGFPFLQYCRNKIRTTKYTPLTFVPKNLVFQFKNVANIYFMFIVILGAFPIFGVQNPGLAAVPIVVIVIITMIKDAVEDYRRTLMDLEVNNGLTEILSGYSNPNVVSDHVGWWRRFKKMCTRISLRFARWVEEKNADRIQKKTGVRPAKRSAFNQEIVTASDLASVYSRESFDLGDRERTNYDSPRDPDSVIDPTLVSSDSIRFRPDFWKNVRVGDFVRVRCDQEIPADLVILATSEEDGCCYVETKNLDGETNLKNRQALQCGKGIRHSSDCQQSDFWIESEVPMQNLYAFNGVLKWQVSGEEHNEPININNLLLRGCMLRNTKWIVGVVLFTGPDTKIMMNSGMTPTKRSYIQKHLNTLVFCNFAFLFLLCFVSGLVNGIMRKKEHVFISLFELGSPAGSPAANGVVTFWASLILYQSLVPISLYISVEIVKTCQAFFIYSDVYMYYEPIDYPCTPKTWNISDDLGQIEYVFSDKTGTLTQNSMQFKKCTINGVAYGKAYTEALAGMRKRQGINVDAEGREMAIEIAEDRKQMIENMRKIFDNRQLVDDELTFVSNAFIQDLLGAHGVDQATLCRQFMLSLALCNSVITEKHSSGRVEFKAQSPDEAALVSTASDVGFGLVERTRKSLILNVEGKAIEYPLLATLEFNSTRKRMSTIVRMPDTGKIKLICKGADSVIYSRLKPHCQEELRRQTAIQLEEFASEGLRTLCIAERTMSESEFEEFIKKHEVAAASIFDREHKLEEVASEFERDLMLVGGTAIEDRLQDGVPRTIQLLGDGGIKLWVLTGDKVETAINIGFSCNLLTNEMQLLTIKIEDGDKGSVPALIDEYLFTHFGMQGSFDELEAAKTDHSVPSPKFAVIIDGEALKLALNPVIQHKFLLLCKQCRSVMCCRVSPSQKAAVVRMVRSTLDVITLAIGDGANDVAMIQEANVGVGIAGEEGRAAAMSSDYAFGQFRFLARLLLVHGRYSYRRLAEMVPNFFYKNAMFTLTLFWYGIFTNFDATYLYDYTYVMFYNLAFTSLPVIIMGIVDQDVPDRISLAVPQLYRRGILRKDFSLKKFWLYMGEGCYQSFVCFFFAYFMFSNGRFVDELGYPANHRYWMGLATCTLSVMSCNLYVITNQYRWDWVSILINCISSLCVWIWSGIYSSFMASAETYGIARGVYAEVCFWAIVLLGCITCMLFHFMFMTVRAFLDPQDVDIIREQWRLGEFDTVMATPLAADDPDAANYENPYRPDTLKPKKMQVFKRRRNFSKQPYEIPNDSHRDILISPDMVKLGEHEIPAEEYDWDKVPSAQSPRGDPVNRNRDLSPHRQGDTVLELASRHASPELRRSIEQSRRNTVWEQNPIPGIDSVLVSGGLEDEITTALGLVQREPRDEDDVPEDIFDTELKQDY